MISLFKNWVTNKHKKTPQAIHSTSIQQKNGTESAPLFRRLPKKAKSQKWTSFMFIIFCTTIEIKRKVAGKCWSFFIWSDLHCLNTHKNYSVNRKSIYRKSCAGYCAAVRDLVCLTGSGEATLFFVVVLAEIFDRELFFLFGFWTRSFETFGTTVFLALEAAKDR